MCVYQDCPYLCLTKKEHHSRYARIRRNNTIVVPEIKKKSPKVNWDVVNEMKMKKSINEGDESK